MKTLSSLFVAALLLSSGMAHAAEIRVLSTRATEELYRELAPQFEQASGHKLATTFTGTLDARRRVEAGEAYDVVIMIDTAIDELIAAGKVRPGSRVDIARTVIGAGVRAGLPKPDISTREAVKNALLAARSIGYSTGPSGTYLLELIETLGISDAIRPKLRQAPSGVLVGSLIAAGEAELGFHQANELSHFPGVDFIGPLPAEMQEPTRRSGALLAGSKVVEAAEALLAYLSGPAAAPVIRKHGLEPARAARPGD